MFTTYYWDVIKNHYVDFKGRATRKQFWMFFLFNFIVTFVLAALGEMDNTVGLLFTILYALYGLAVLLPNLGLSVRRLHDVNRSGWWLLIYLVPFVGWLVLFIFFVLPSNNTNNRF